MTCFGMTCFGMTCFGMTCFGASAYAPFGRHDLLRHDLLRNTCLMGIMCVSVGVFVYSVVIQQSSTSVDLHQSQYDGCVSSESSIQNNESVNSVVIEGTAVLLHRILAAPVVPTHVQCIVYFLFNCGSYSDDDSYSLCLRRFRVVLWRCPSHSYIGPSPPSSRHPSSKSIPSSSRDLFCTRDDNIIGTAIVF